MSEAPGDYLVVVIPPKAVQATHSPSETLVYCNRYSTIDENRQAALEALQKEIARVQR